MGRRVRRDAWIRRRSGASAAAAAAAAVRRRRGESAAPRRAASSVARRARGWSSCSYHGLAWLALRRVPREDELARRAQVQRRALLAVHGSHPLRDLFEVRLDELRQRLQVVGPAPLGEQTAARLVLEAVLGHLEGGRHRQDRRVILQRPHMHRRKGAALRELIGLKVDGQFGVAASEEVAAKVVHGAARPRGLLRRRQPLRHGLPSVHAAPTQVDRVAQVVASGLERLDVDVPNELLEAHAPHGATASGAGQAAQRTRTAGRAEEKRLWKCRSGSSPPRRQAGSGAGRAHTHDPGRGGGGGGDARNRWRAGGGRGLASVGRAVLLLSGHAGRGGGRGRWGGRGAKVPPPTRSGSMPRLFIDTRCAPGARVRAPALRSRSGVRGLANAPHLTTLTRAPRPSLVSAALLQLGAAERKKHRQLPGKQAERETESNPQGAQQKR